MKIKENSNKLITKSKFKRTSIGRNGVPLNKHKKRSWKAYKGQGSSR